METAATMAATAPRNGAASPVPLRRSLPTPTSLMLLLRWLLAPMLCASGLAVAATAALFFVHVGEQLCRAASSAPLPHSTCMGAAPTTLAISLGLAIGAACMVVFPAWMAPRSKAAVAVAALLAGSVIATWLASLVNTASVLAPYLSSLFAGSAAAFYVRSRWKAD